MAVSRRELDVPELNLIPIMNLVTILIPFLIMAAQFVQLSVIDSTLPAISQSTVPQEKPDKPPFSLSLIITNMGIRIMGADPILHPGGAPVASEGGRPPDITCGDGGQCRNLSDYDWSELTKLLSQIKDAHPDEQNVILVPGDDIQYEVIVKAMDASRDDGINGGSRELFPYVVLAGGSGGSK